MFSATRLSVLVCLALGFVVNAAPAGSDANLGAAANLDHGANLGVTGGSHIMTADDVDKVMANLGLTAGADSTVDKRQILENLGLGTNFSLNDLLSALGFFNVNALVTTTSNGVVVSVTATASATATATTTATDTSATVSFTGTSISLPTLSTTVTGTSTRATSTSMSTGTRSATASATATVGVNNDNGLSGLLSTLFGGRFGNVGANGNAGANANFGGLDLSQLGL